MGGNSTSEHIDLSKITYEKPLQLEKELTLEQQIQAFNENVFGLPLNEDYKYPFEISDNMLKIIKQEKGTYWGSLEQVCRYSMTVCIDLGYIPWKLVYYEFDKDDIDGGSHKFYIVCEDRRITSRTGDAISTGLGQP